MSWLVPRIAFPILTSLVFLIHLTRLRASMHVIPCLNCTSGTLLTSTRHGSNHWATGRSRGSPKRLPWCATTSTVRLFAVDHPVPPILLTGSLSFVYVNSAYHVISKPLSVVARFEIRARARSVASSSANSAEEHRTLTIPNPLRSLSSKSVETIASRDVEGAASEGLAPPNTDLSRLWFGPDQDVGEAVFSSSPRGLRGLCSRYVVARDTVVGLAWTDAEVLVRTGTPVAMASHQRFDV